jgi:predicted nuclease of restriction endonuclease-like (RecB) superfamily
VAKIDSTDPAQPTQGSEKIQIVQRVVAQLSWAHNVILIQKLKDMPTRFWYARQVISQGWSRDTLSLMIKSHAHKRQGAALTNFDMQLPEAHAQLARDTLKDPYIFDFLTLDKPFRERELEASLVEHLEQFLLELGAGFAFVGRQVHLDIAEEDFYIDLLFYHLQLRSFVVVDLKIGPFKPEYAGKINFYCNVVDDRLKHDTDHPTIGLILCQDKNKVVAEYALRGMSKLIGVSEYELTRALPESLKSVLPTIEEIEAELGTDIEKMFDD